jgi:hypothetical protein
MVNERIKITCIKAQLYDFLTYMLKQKTLKFIGKWLFNMDFWK